MHSNKMKIMALTAFSILLMLLFVIPAGAAGTSEVTIQKIADDGTTVLNQTTVTAMWMEQNLPVQGDGVTHYYHQGPVFEGAWNASNGDYNPWNPEEDVNCYPAKDQGAVKGTDIKDLCDLIGGAEAGDEIQLVSSDGLDRTFGYFNVYTPPDRQGKMVLTWYKDGQYSNGSYTDGMKNVFFADNSINPWQEHIFGAWDMHESFADQYWYNYTDQGKEYPSTTGLGVKYINKIKILTDEPAPAKDTLFDAELTLEDATCTVNATSEVSYEVDQLTPLGALKMASLEGEGFNINVTDKKFSELCILMLDDIDQFIRKNPGYWECYVNGAKLDGYSNNDTEGLNVKALSDGDTVNFYYAEGSYDIEAVNAGNALAEVLITVNTTAPPAPVVDTVFSGEVVLTNENTTVSTIEGVDYQVNKLTPLGALKTASLTGEGFAINVTNKKFDTLGILMLNDIEEHFFVKSTVGWECYVNGQYMDGYNNPDTQGLNIKTLQAGDTVNFYYVEIMGDNEAETALNATAKVLITVASPAPVVDTVFSGEITLTDENITLSTIEGVDYQVNKLTPLGALKAASLTGEGFAINVTNKKFDTLGILMLNDIEEHFFVKSTAGWECYVNGQYMDGYNNPDTQGLNIKTLSGGDTVNFYYVEIMGDNEAGTAQNATAKVLITVDSVNPDADYIYNGEVLLSDGNTTVTAPGGATYEVKQLTPLGALQVASEQGDGFAFNVSDKKMLPGSDKPGLMLLDDIESYMYVDGKSWCCFVNGVLLDDWNNYLTDGFNLKTVANGDKVVFCYGTKGLTTLENAEAVVKMTVSTSVEPPVSWKISLTGKNSAEVTKTQYEADVLERGVEYTDADGTWKGLPLYCVVGKIDDDDPETFNEALAAEGYSIKLTCTDGSYSINFESSDIANSNDYILANTLDGEILPETIGEDKPCFPLRMIGNQVAAGQLIGSVSTIELIGLPEEPKGWNLKINGVLNDTITQAEFEEGGCHRINWTDPNGDVWSGVPLWVMASVSDNIESTGHWTFDDDAAANGYTARLVASDGFSRDFASADIARNSSFILADKLNGQALEVNEDKPVYPLKLVGDSLWDNDQNKFSGSAIGGVVEIDLVELIPGEPAEGSWNLALEGKIDTVITKDYFALARQCSHHDTTYTDANGCVWEGIPLYDLCGWVDDRVSHGSSGFNMGLATTGYTVVMVAADGYSKEIPSSLIVAGISDISKEIIVADRLNGSALEYSSGLRVVGPGLPANSYSIGNLSKIKLTEFQIPVDAPTLTIVKYGADGITEVENVTVTYADLESQFDVYGDGETLYKFEGLCFAEGDPWDMGETYPGGFKITEPMKGTAVSDICSLVGGMPEETEIKFIAECDGWTTKLSYDVIYNDREANPRLGTPVLAWYGYAGTGKGAMPAYGDGFRLFYETDDHIFGQRDMFETIPSEYWHYNSGLPSCAGLSPKYVSRIELQTVPDAKWNLSLHGAIDATISKGFFEGAMGCTMAQGEESHKATYTDASGNEWAGMPLWLLCGFVDDANPHTGRSYDTELAQAGYDIIITGEDGKEVTIDSRDTIRSQNYIIANTKNDVLLRPGDGLWPLKLVGENVTGEMSVDNITSITLGIEAPETGTITLRYGWNFISTPKRLSDGKNTASIFSDVDTDGHPVYQYDAATATWKTLTSSSPINPLEAVWIYSKQTDDVVITYTNSPLATPPSKKLSKGWNAIGFGNTQNAPANIAFMTVADNWVYALKYNSVNKNYDNVIVNGGTGIYADSRELQPTDAFWLYSKEECYLSALTV
ncbi:hypothetical protein F1737_09860 [Methanoplanus sp. FWC-SCC4]|uniref:DUF4430 domain-containing protein n=1 Tax=Methanochimaera problematica TaxID=2609417 RepID=A0AA97FEZ4_9EURY|nr:hypothetical protein [Methanoplanus sp. FWC-SCC4]WOF16969.1 hypothetical protein F1737_09860 [Methanoplanus sp. FWC-SCC4]